MKRSCMNCKYEYFSGGIDPCYSCAGMPGLPYFDAKAPPKPITNADRLRAMSDEELAEWLVIVERRVVENALSKPFNYTDKQLKADWLEWLRQEAENE